VMFVASTPKSVSTQESTASGLCRNVRHTEFHGPFSVIPADANTGYESDKAMSRGFLQPLDAGSNPA
jgi:hypothetical protein